MAVRRLRIYMELEGFTERLKGEKQEVVMQTEPITIHVSVRAARAFRKASPAMQRHIQELLEFSLMDEEELDEEAFQAATEELERAVDEMGANARRRGLTDERLDEILNDPNRTAEEVTTH